jgi:Ca2+:H+ antiporter
MKWLLLFLPLAIALEHLAPERTLAIFACAALAIIPLAALMARATGVLASKLGPAIGGLLNATFGNAAEFIICLAALRSGLQEMVKASLAGAIFGNILLVLGVAMLVGGWRRREQRYNPAAVRSLASMLTLAVIALVLPAIFVALAPAERESLGAMSVWIAVALIAVYACNVFYTLVTHRQAPTEGEGAQEAHAHAVAPWKPGVAAGVLAGATVGIVWMSEVLVGVIEPATESLGLSPWFAGVFVLAVLGSAAEQATAIVAAKHDRMDLAMSIALGASVQLALLITPLLVLASHFVGPAPMPLLFGPGLVLTLVLAVLITGQIAGDGRSDWLRGVQLLAVYLILAGVYYHAPGLPEG